MNAKPPGVHRRIEAATRAVEATKTASRPVPAKILATGLDPNAKRARPRVSRTLQLLKQELNDTPARLPGDRRPLTYQVAGT
jgi:hypothetical protein